MGPIYHRLFVPYDNARCPTSISRHSSRRFLRVWSGSRKPAGLKSKPQHAGHHDEVGRSRVMCHESRSLQQAACFCVLGMRSTDVDPWLEVIFVNANDATHARISPITSCKIATAILPP